MQRPYYPADMHVGRVCLGGAHGLVTGLLIGLLVVGCTAEQPLASEAAGPMASDFPSSPLPGPSSWTSLKANPLVSEPFSGVGNQYVIATVAYLAGFVAVGEDFQFHGANDGPVTGAIWSSPDGLAWSRVDPGAAYLANAQIDHLATDGRRLVAVGSARPLGAPPDNPTPIVWVSSDGANWNRVSSKPAFEHAVSGIAGGPAGF